MLRYYRTRTINILLLNRFFSTFKKSEKAIAHLLVPHHLPFQMGSFFIIRSFFELVQKGNTAPQTVLQPDHSSSTLCLILNNLSPHPIYFRKDLEYKNLFFGKI